MGASKNIETAGDRLMSAVEKTAPIVVGLDPRLTDIPSHIKENALREGGPGPAGAALAITLFNKGIIDAIKDIVPAVKPQIAFYEQFGWVGVKAYEETITYARQAGLIVIGDAKRNDIGSTAQAYADGHLGTVSMMDGSSQPVFDCDWLTVNGYLGSDGIAPFLETRPIE
jgi:orotidine-5'-phosphate decarboxylase